MKIKELKKVYQSACNEYVDKFCKKQEMENEGWVANQVGGVALCSDFYFNFDDIVLDVNTKQPKGVIIDWYDDNLKNPDKSINYYSYIIGLRVKDISKILRQSEQFYCDDRDKYGNTECTQQCMACVRDEQAQ